MASRAELTRPNKCGRIVPPEVIMAAKRRPDGCSDVRWRIELRRRADKERYEMASL